MRTNPLCADNANQDYSFSVKGEFIFSDTGNKPNKPMNIYTNEYLEGLI